MKKLFLTFSILLLGTFVFGQVVTPPDSTKKEFKNALVIDATGLLQQFFHLSEGSYFYDPYMFRYKRFFKSNAIRVNIGGHFYTSDNTANDTISGSRSDFYFVFGVGYERYVYLSNRWNLYYGADAIFTYSFNDSHTNFSQGNSWDQSTLSYGYGVSPLLGVQFRINSRLSIATETSYDLIFGSSFNNRSTKPPSYGDSKTKNTGFSTSFHAPTTIQFRIQL